MSEIEGICSCDDCLSKMIEIDQLHTRPEGEAPLHATCEERTSGGLE